MKTKLLYLTLTIVLMASAGRTYGQTLGLSSELKELINLSVNKDYKVADQKTDKEIAKTQQKALRSAYLPQVEIGGKYLYAYSTLNSDIDEISGFESVNQLLEFMQNPAFPVLFPTLAELSSEITSLQELLVQQGITLPSPTEKIAGTIYGNYFGLDASVKMLLYSGGQVPNTAKALGQNMKASEAMSDKCTTDVISEVINYYDQLALLNQSKKVLDESAVRLASEKKYAFSALNNGFATSFDTLKIAVAEANLQAKLSEYESKKALLFQKLAQLTGKPDTYFNNLDPELQPLLYADQGSDINKRAELQALSAGVEAKKYMVKAAKSCYLPKVQAVATARYDNIFAADADLSDPLPIDTKINNIGLGPSFIVGVGFKWDVFDRPNGSLKVRQAELELKKSENAKDEATELLQLNQTKSVTNYLASNSQVQFKEKQLQAARMALNLAVKSYNDGMINITERLAAETEMQNSELEYLQAIFAQRQATIDCYKATGDLTLNNIK
jgi:outer membrane protein TolC